VFGPAGTTKFLASVGAPLPELATWIAIIVELIGGILILIGFQTRWVALVLAIWCLFTALGFHLPSSAVMHDVTQVYKNVAIAGGLLYVFAFGPGIWSVDHSMGKA
jgi:putative oxidoreductase